MDGYLLRRLATASQNASEIVGVGLLAVQLLVAAGRKPHRLIDVDHCAFDLHRGARFETSGPGGFEIQC